MTELLSMENITVVGLLLVACAYLVKSNDKNMVTIMQQHAKEEERLVSEMKDMKEERRQERKEWLGALNDNTEQLKYVADKLGVIPQMQSDIDRLGDDMQEIKMIMKVGGACD